MREVEPYILASYEMAREDVSCSKNRKCEFRGSSAILDELVKRRSIPDFKWALVELSYIRDAQGHFNESAEFARKALAVDPKFAPAYTSLGNALRQLGRPEEAIANYKEAIGVDANDYHAYNGWGMRSWI